MKKRYILLAAIAVIAVLSLLVLNADICIGRIESRTEDQWSHIHLYMNDEITVDFPIEGEDRPCIFQYETGRGAFSVTITDAQGNILYSDARDNNGKAAFTASSDLTLRIRGDGHGGVFSLTRLEELGPEEDPYNINRILGEGIHTGAPFTATYSCRKVEGKRVNFYVENRGTEDVILTINGSYSRILPPGGSGHISATISSTIVAQSMTLKCVSADGGDLDIYWKAAQRN